MYLYGALLKNKWHRFRMRGRSLHPLAKANLKALQGMRLDDPARSQNYVVVDLETTGLNHKRDRVVSVGAFRVVQGRVRLGDFFSELVNPGRDIPVESIKIHTIVPDMIVSARPAWDVFEDFLAYIGSDILVAHYAPLDLHFLNWVMSQRFGFKLQNVVLDTVAICRSVLLMPSPYGVYLDHKKCSLEALTEMFGIDVPERHTALGDALATAMVFQRMLLIMEEKGMGTLRELIHVGGLS